jgi:UDP-N-acetylmuramoyl-L-alanyl-D-glutamate--2,6-diaminopimelate ligase
LKNLKDILYKVNIEAVHGITAININNIHFDSRKIELDDVFVAINGVSSNGHDYIEKALNLGAIAIICEVLPKILVNGVTYILVKDSQVALAIIAANFYDNPSAKLQLVGVTGTNGKTTIASLLHQLTTKAGFSTGLLSTVKILIGNQTFEATHTTPDSLTINYYLNEMVNQGVAYCFMEVSSHGIHQKRTHGLTFRGGIFSNLSHDHLDYHNSFAEYRDVKKQFFDQLPKDAFALINLDDKNGTVMTQNTKANIKTYALKTYANYTAKILESQISGQLIKINNLEVWVKPIGVFNVYNLLAIYATAIELGFDQMEVLTLLSELESVSGRFQYFKSEKNITAIVDYAHTPDALENVLKTISEIRTNNETLITVVGCGGDRDKTKRPLMAKIAAELSNKVILTSDNPRTEDPISILKDMEAGIEPHLTNKVLTIENREQAIKTASQLAQSGDIILIAGKGHENYQEIQGVKYPFDDLAIIKNFITT